MKLPQIAMGLGFLMLAGLLSIQSSVEASGIGWVFHQKSDYLGQQQTYVNNTGLKISSKVLTTIVFAPPSKKVVMYNDKTRSFFQSTFDEWARKHMGRSKTAAAMRQIRRGSNGTVAGLPAGQYFFENIVNGTRRVTEEYWVAADNSLPKEVVEAMDKLFDFPPGLGIPLRIYKINSKGVKVLTLDTLSYERKDLPANVFSYPTGYTLVKDPMTLILGPEDL